MESFNLPSESPATSTAHIALFRNVRNAAALRGKLVAAATTDGEEGDRLKAEVDFSLIDGSMIVSREHILTAVYQAVQTSERGTLRTPQIHSEILLALLPTYNITDAIKRFGISTTSNSVLVVRVASQGGDEDDNQALVDEIAELVEGSMVELDEIDALVDWPKVKKVYKLNEIPEQKGEREDLHLLESAIITALATKAVT